MSQQDPAFGRVLTAMVTPFDESGAPALDTARRLAAWLVDEQGCDGLVVNGTTGESPTTSDEEKRQVLAAVVDEVSDRASIVAGVGTNHTAHSVQLARQARDCGADALLVVTPYYSRPPAAQLEEHFVTVADAGELPVMLYDIPHRAGLAISEASLMALSQHRFITAVKDAKLDVISSAQVIADSTLDYYAGDDAYLLPLLAVGAVGVVGTATHFTGRQSGAIVRAFLEGDLAEAQRINAQVLPVMRGVFASQGSMMVKAALNARGWEVGGCRAPMGEVPNELLERFLSLLDTHL